MPVAVQIRRARRLLDKEFARKRCSLRQGFTSRRRLCGCCFRGFLFGACPREGIGQAIVPLMTCVLEDRALEPLEEEFTGPRFCPSPWILHRETVNNGLCINTSEALDDVHFLARKNILPSICGRPTE